MRSKKSSTDKVLQNDAYVSVNGSLRYNKDKLPMDLVPVESIKALARVLQYGAKKYDLHNWRKGANWSVPYASLMRHLTAFWDGEDFDNESGLSHLDHVIANASMLVEYFKEFKELDDRYNTVKGK